MRKDKPQFKKEYANLSPEQQKNIIQQYELEVEYAEILKNTSNSAERGKLYHELYDKYFKKLPAHPLLLRSKDKKYIEEKVKRTIRFLYPYINPSTHFMEIGSGDCSLTIGLSAHVKEVVGVDVSEEIMPEKSGLPENVKLYVSRDGTTLPFQQNYFHIAYSNQLIEHLHPDDAKIHIMNVRQILTKNGQYIFQTPHMFFGPHDVSVFFHNTPVGFHLKEYCNFELYFLLKKVGFTKVNLITGIKGRRISLPIIFPVVIELVLFWFPHSIRKYLSLLTPLRKCLNGHIIAVK